MKLYSQAVRSQMVCGKMCAKKGWVRTGRARGEKLACQSGEADRGKCEGEERGAGSEGRGFDTLSRAGRAARGTRSSFKTSRREGDSPLLLRRLRKRGQSPIGFETASSQESRDKSQEPEMTVAEIAQCGSGANCSVFSG